MTRTRGLTNIGIQTRWRIWRGWTRRCRHLRASRPFLTRLGRVEVRRTYFRCGSCGGECFSLDRALGLEGETVPLMGFEAASRHVANPARVVPQDHRACPCPTRSAGRHWP